MAKKSTTKKSTTRKLKATVSSYKDTPVINIPLDKDTKLILGPAKAMAILSNMQDLVTFVQPKPTSKNAKISKFRGHDMLNLVKQGRPFSLGVKKAQTVIQYAGEIASFVASNS